MIVGLGNPGPGYVETPHNVGFKVADELARRWDLGKPKKKFNAELFEGRTRPGGPRIAMLKPQTFMNEAGRSAGPARGSFKLELDRVLVLHDEIDLPFGDIRSRLGGGLAGHNGLKSLKREFGAPDFHRVRIGVGRPDSTDPEIVASYVLGRWRQPSTDVADLISARQTRPSASSSSSRLLYAITYGRMPPREWDASSYDRVSDPQLAMARDVIDRLDLRGDERVLDAGCGTGRVTELLAARAGTVIAVDGSAAMVEQTRARRDSTPSSSDLVELELDEPVDAILSTATFHWIEDHDRLFARLHAALKPGGRLAAQCGGAGNIANVQAAIDAVDEPAFRGWAGPWNYATPEETARAAARRRLHRRLDVAAAVAGRARRTRTSTSRP